MRVTIEADIFRSDRLDRDQHKCLLSLFALGIEGIHAIDVAPRSDARFRDWLNGESSRTRQMCEFAIEQGQKMLARQRTKRKVRIAMLDVPSWKDMRLPLDVALRLLQRPLVLLLENARNDRNFLHNITQLAPQFDLNAFIKNRHIDIQTGGGSDNKKWLEDKHRTPDELAQLWVLSDSDARRPWRDGSKEMHECLSSSVRELAAACKTRGVPIHILTRRSIENYLPLPVLKNWSARDHVDPKKRKREAKYEAFSTLRAEQRHHYKMKDGFEQDRKDAMHSKMVGTLYDDVPVEVMEMLADGFGDDIADLFSGQILTTWLRNDKQEQEARDIVESILEHL